MTAQSDLQSPSKQRRTTLRVFYVFVLRLNRRIYPGSPCKLTRKKH